MRLKMVELAKCWQELARLTYIIISEQLINQADELNENVEKLPQYRHILTIYAFFRVANVR
jgi:hypothetical protein